MHRTYFGDNCCDSFGDLLLCYISSHPFHPFLSSYAPVLLDFKSPWLEIANFFGLVTGSDEAARLGVEPFPVGSLCRTNFQKENLQTLYIASQGLRSLSKHRNLHVLAGGDPTFLRMKDDCEWWPKKNRWRYFSTASKES